MKKVAETPYNGFDESASRLIVYAFDDEHEHKKLNELSHDELCEHFNVCDDSGYEVRPGGTYYRYDFEIDYQFLVMRECVALNV